MNIKDKNLSEGHRERLRKRFEKSGFKGFHDYEILEFILTYAIPRKDTKPQAKKLIKKFGSFSKVFDAPVEKIMEVDGIGKNAAILLKTLREVITEYYRQSALERKSFLKLDELVDYLKATIGGRQNEVVHVIYMNSKNELLHTEDLSEGTVSEAVAFPRKIVENALRHHATSVILAHNHTDGLPEPSESDNMLTASVRKALKTVDVNLQEHVIISDNGFYSYRKSGYFDIK